MRRSVACIKSVQVKSPRDKARESDRALLLMPPRSIELLSVDDNDDDDEIDIREATMVVGCGIFMMNEQYSY